MKKDSLKEWFKVEVWRQSGGTLPELCDLSEIREWLNETADDPDLAARISVLEKAPHKMDAAAPGAPVAPVASSISIPIDTGISLDFTAKTKGSAGDSITIALLDPDYEGILSVSVEGSDISVKLGYGEGAITSRLADVKTAIDGDEDAAALVSVAITGEDTTLAIAVAKTALENGVDGTPGAAGALRFDGDKLYVSVDESTVAESNWKSITFDA